MAGGSDPAFLAAKQLLLVINDEMLPNIPYRDAKMTEVCEVAFRALRAGDPNPDWKNPETFEFLCDTAEEIMKSEGIWNSQLS